MNNLIQALVQRQENGENLNFQFFWGHKGTGIGPHVLSQWYYSPFVYEGNMYPTAEHWMMVKKAELFDDPASVQAILETTNPSDAKSLGRKVLNFDLGVWQLECFNIVTIGNILKFRQNPLLLQYLESTRDSILVEASPYDVVWGIGMYASNDCALFPAQWNGQNLLGFALMEARTQLREAKYKDTQ